MSEVFKVPHHGSADFSGAMFQAVSPVVSIVSSGDESAQKEYIHPRATLVGALGKWSRVPEPLIFVTELVAFFNVEGWSKLSDPKTKAAKGTRRVLWFQPHRLRHRQDTDQRQTAVGLYRQRQRADEGGLRLRPRFLRRSAAFRCPAHMTRTGNRVFGSLGSSLAAHRRRVIDRSRAALCVQGARSRSIPVA